MSFVYNIIKKEKLISKEYFILLKGEQYMNLAKISANGQITVPIEIRTFMGLKAGDKILFYFNENKEIVISNASSSAILKAQRAFEGVAESLGVTSEDDIQSLVDEYRGKED